MRIQLLVIGSSKQPVKMMFNIFCKLCKCEKITLRMCLFENGAVVCEKCK